MLIIGLTGGIGSGKSIVAHEFAQLGVPIIDTDIIARDIVQQDKQILSALTAHFGKNILHQDGTLDRAALRQIIFNHPEHKKWLEDLLHPLILQKAKDEAQQVTAPYVIIVIPLLVETGCDDLVNRVLVVDCDEQLQISRVQQRDHNDFALIEKMIAAQATRQQRLAHANEIITNNTTLDDLKQQILQLHYYYLELTKHWRL